MQQKNRRVRRGMAEIVLRGIEKNIQAIIDNSAGAPRNQRLRSGDIKDLQAAAAYIFETAAPILASHEPKNDAEREIVTRARAFSGPGTPATSDVEVEA